MISSLFLQANSRLPFDLIFILECLHGAEVGMARDNLVKAEKVGNGTMWTLTIHFLPFKMGLPIQTDWGKEEWGWHLFPHHCYCRKSHKDLQAKQSWRRLAFPVLTRANTLVCGANAENWRSIPTFAVQCCFCKRLSEESLTISIGKQGLVVARRLVQYLPLMTLW